MNLHRRNLVSSYTPPTGYNVNIYVRPILRPGTYYSVSINHDAQQLSSINIPAIAEDYNLEAVGPSFTYSPVSLAVTVTDWTSD